MKRSILCAALLGASVTRVLAQDFDYGKPTGYDLQQTSYQNDPSAKAMVLNEFGETRIGESGDRPLRFYYHVKMKVFQTDGFAHGDITIPLHTTSDGTSEEIVDLRGYAASLGSSGAIQMTPLAGNKVFREKIDKNVTLVKFAIPNITPNSVVEFSYTIESPYVFNFWPWQFQWDIPKARSTYIAHIPAVYDYNVSLRGPLKLTKNVSDLERECFTVGSLKADCSRITYQMDNVPAFVEEENMTAAKNFLSAINFELSQYQDYAGQIHKVTRDWADIDKQLKTSTEFGSQFKNGDVFKAQIAQLKAENSDPLALAKATYTMIGKSIRWNGRYNPFSPDGIKRAADAHAGTIGDVNLALTAALIYEGFDADAVLLSTRGNGLINRLFPVVSDFDYVVAHVTVAGKQYLLDASDPDLPFGLLPIRCINDQGRVMSRTKPSYWVDLKPDQKRSRVVNMDLKLSETGKITGHVISYSKGYEALERRKAIRKFNSIAEYVEDLDEKMPRLKIIKSSVENLDSLDNVLVENFQVEVDAYPNLDQAGFLFNPFFLTSMKENPFKLKQRDYPVDWGAPLDYKTNVVFTLPQYYTLTNPPTGVGLALPLAGGKYVCSSSAESGQVMMSEQLQLDKIVYSTSEYPYLKELFNKVVQQRNTDLMFKKQ